GVYEEMGFHVVLVGRKRKSKYEPSDWKVKRFRLLFNKGPLFYLSYSLRLFRFLMGRKSVDIVVSNDADTLLGAGLARIFRPFFWVYDSHEYFVGVPEIKDKPFVQKVWKWIEQKYVPKTRLRLTVSGAVSQLLEKRGLGQFLVVRNIPKKKESIKTVPWSERPFRILYPGMINPGRGLEAFLEAVPLMKSDVQVVIMGRGPNENALKDKMLGLDIEDRVRFTGAVPYARVWEEMKATHLGLVLEEPLGASFAAALPNKIFDFMQAGIPVLAGEELPEVMHLLSEVPFARFVDGSPESIAQAVDYLADNEQAYKELQGKAVLHRDNYTWEQERKVVLDELGRYFY
ncbi:MAG: glycosyltransferase involved in cell wall biosynthesis, partial [Sphingobacteriales bacterium]